VNIHKSSGHKISERISSSAAETRADVVEEEDVKVYVISSEGGYIIYHVDSTSLKQLVADVKISVTSHVRGVDATEVDFPADGLELCNSLDTNVTSCGKSAVFSESTFTDGRGTQQEFAETDISDGDFDRRGGNCAKSIVDKIINELVDVAIMRSLNADNDDSVDSSRSSHGSANGLDCEDDAPLKVHNHGCDFADIPSDLSSSTVQSAGDMSPIVHPLYAHILLYVRKFDTHRAMYALGRLRAILATSANVIVRALTTSNVGGTSTPRAMLLQSLLVQHRRSVLGRRFSSDDTESGASGIRSSMFIDVLVTICLYYMRGYYPNLLAPSLTPLDIEDNARLQVSAADILTTVLDELAVMTRTGGRGFATYICDLLDKCKVSIKSLTMYRVAQNKPDYSNYQPSLRTFA